VEETELVREYRRRHPLKGQLSGVWLSVVCALCEVYRRLRNDGPVARGVAVGFLIALVFGLTWLLLFLRRGFTRVYADGVTIGGALRTRRIPWHEVYKLGVRPLLRAGKAASFVGTVHGRRHALPQLNEWQMEGLHTELAVLRDIGARYGGRAWERRPEIEQALRRRAGRI
jgi:hypothetical protein